MIEEGGIYEDSIEVLDRFAISENAIVEILDELDVKIGYTITKSRKRKLFSTITEIVQNINNYTEKGANHENKCAIGYDEKGSIFIEATNLINRFNKDSLEEKLVNLEKMDQETLDNKYYETLNNGIHAKDRRNGLGIIVIVKNAKQLFYDFERITLNLYNFKLKLVF